MELTIPARHCGPPVSGNGGWVGGRLAELVPTTPERPAVSVRLQAPPPLERPLQVREGEGGLVLADGQTPVALATAVAAPTDPVAEPVDLATARAARERFDGFTDHPFPTCYACGPDNPVGLHMHAGPVLDGTHRYAVDVTPVDSSLPTLWAMLDCPGGWASGFAGRPMVLGTMTVHALARPVPGEEHVVVAWPTGSKGRVFRSGTALYAVSSPSALTTEPAAEPRLVARAEAVWISIDPTDHGGTA